MAELDGQVVIVTGAASGIGLGIARVCSAASATPSWNAPGGITMATAESAANGPGSGARGTPTRSRSIRQFTGS